MRKFTTIVTMIATGTALAWSTTASASTFTFSNGCTRSCTGDWGSGSQAGNVVCNGTAGPLTCGGALTAGNTGNQTARRVEATVAPTPPGSNFTTDGRVVQRGRGQR